MGEQNTTPAEMLDAAANAIKELSPRVWVWTGLKPATIAEAALRAAGVPDLVAQYNEACKLLAVRVEAKRLDDAMTRIMELEAALRDRICERCDKLMANVGQLHLCGCQDQRNLCSACKAGCACAGGEQ